MERIVPAAGSRLRARMLRITAAEQTPCSSASWQALSTALNPSVRTQVRIDTICRSPSSAAPSLRRTFSMADGRTHSRKGAPLRRPFGLRASTGT